MRSFFTKKRSLVALAAVATVVVASAAFAAFTSSGSGSGNANVGTDNGGNWTVNQTAANGTLYPDPAGTGGAVGNGANVETVTYDVTNSTAKGSLLLGSVTAQIATNNGGAWSSQTNQSDPACTASDFSINGKPVGTSATDTTLANTDVNAGATSPTSTFQIEMIDNGKNQDNCEELTPPIYYTAN